ncbi:HD domain-containing protein [Sphingomonas sabuli]|uniref:HD domain-containing protein n=1 Tax=Sphingomonas sabuli TaxID=2764186 RepID=A0A7G9L0H8_9SPHN|nr:HD domain-containing protein [Sphingomonas sabuli]QNM82127.1 HD domain-containing protein [Sphingomonas sabuli]
MFHQPIQAGQVHRAEILAAFSYALDLTEGQPDGHSIRCCWIASQIGRAIGLGAAELGDLYYAVLLKDLGCSSNSARICELYAADDRAFKQGYKTVGTSLAATLHFVLSKTARGRPWTERAATVGNILVNGPQLAQELILTRCTRGADIARKLRFPDAVCRAIYHLDEHWDGSGKPDRLRGDAIPLYSRLALLAQVADVFHTHAGSTAATDEVQRRSGTWLGPELVAAFTGIAASGQLWLDLRSPILEAKVVARAPVDDAIVADDDFLDTIASAFGEVIDAKSPFTAGHSRRVADLAARMGARLGLDPVRVRLLRRAAFLHDVGKLGVSSTILEKPGPLDDEEWQAMRGHADQTRQVLGRIGTLADMADIAAAHHERLDGAGYPLRLGEDALALETRIISVCDFYDALIAERPYRGAMPQAKALAIMEGTVGSAIDPGCFDALKIEIRD